MCKLIILQDGIFFQLTAVYMPTQRSVLVCLVLKLRVCKKKIRFLYLFYFYLKNVREVYMVITVLTHVRYRTLDIAVCSGGALVLVIPVTFHHRYAPRRQVRRNEINRKNTYFNRNLFGLFDIALKTNTIREVFPRSARNGQEIAIEVEQFEKQTRYPSN